MLRLKRILHDNVKDVKNYIYRSKLRRKSQIKDKTRDWHKHDLVHYSKSAEPTFNEHYWEKLEEELLKV